MVLLLRRWKVNGLDHLPPQGGLVIVSNHTSYWDPIIVGCAITRRVNYMAKEELFQYPVFRNIITAMAAFPIKRDQSDRAAIRKALNYLSEGQIVGVFPEGTRNAGETLMAPEMGAAMLALKAGVPVLPIGLVGARGVFSKVTVNIGEPVLYQTEKKYTRGDLEKVSRIVMEKVDYLLR